MFNKKLIEYLVLIILSLSAGGYSADGYFSERDINYNFISVRNHDYDYEEQNLHNAQYVEKNGLLVKRSYYYWLPPTYNAETPVIIALHGGKRSGLSMIDAWHELAKKRSVIIIAPNAINGVWKRGDIDYGFIQSAFKDVAKRYKLKTKTPYLFGHSNGGMLALFLAASHPDFFPVVAVHGAALPDDIKLPKKWPMDYLYSRVAIYLGDQDGCFSFDLARNTGKRMADVGMNVLLYCLISHNHWYYFDCNKINEYAWEFYTGY